jgi:hypothetical protein
MLNFIGIILLLSSVAGAQEARYFPRPNKHAISGSTIEQVISDMSRPSEALVIDPRFDWQYQPRVTMHAPRGDAIPNWWQGNRPLWTNAVVPWFTAFEAQGNRARNSRVQIMNLRFYILSNRTRRWIEVEQRFRPEMKLWAYPFREVGAPCENLRFEKDGSVSVTPKYPYFLHGWGGGHPIDASDVGATFTAMEFRLIVHDRKKKDDREAARYVVDVGADYYPDMSLRWSLDYAPGIGNGRMLLARKHWRTASLLIANRNHGITIDDLRKNPPPLTAREIDTSRKFEPQCAQ